MAIKYFYRKYSGILIAAVLILNNNAYPAQCDDALRPAMLGARSFSKESFLDYVRHGMQITADGMRDMGQKYMQEMAKGLIGGSSSLQMIPAHIAPPTGLETGKYYFLDVGGSNIRAGGVNLLGGGKYNLIGVTKEARFNDSHKSGNATASDLFGYIADNIADYLEANGIGYEDDIIFGLTWSFPVEQTGVDSGIHKFWTKEWQTQGVPGQDPVKLLRDAISQNSRLKGRNIIIQAICNDTVGTFATGRYIDPNCDEGVILGTGTNASYSEALDNILKWRGKASIIEMCINQEWGGFNKISLTEWDRLLDAESVNEGKQILEKTFSGMYLGEIARLIFKDLISKQMLFGGRSSKAFSEKWDDKGNPLGFQTIYMSRITGDTSGNLEEINALLLELGIDSSTMEDRRLLKEISMIVARRGARMAATVMLATVMKNDPKLEKQHSIAIDGSLYEKFPYFKDCMREALSELSGKDASKITMFLVKDGSGVGAAILAAVAHNTAAAFGRGEASSAL